MTDWVVQCVDCEAQAAPLAWRCSVCGGVLDFATYPTFDADRIVAHDTTIWRYGAWLSLEKRLTLGEGLTPLVPTTIHDTPFWAKLEYLNPTGSYKDRGTVTMMNHIAAQGVREVVEDSSGNAGASVAAYSRALDIQARIYVPADGVASKKALIRAFGGELMEIPGPQYAKTAAAEEAAQTTTYASHAYSPYFVLGQMTVAFEVWEQLGRQAPDAIATPLGHGALFLGFARGFRLLYEAGLVDKMPRMIAVQAAACDPIVQAYEQEADRPPELVGQRTVADGIIVDHPVRGIEVLRTIRETKGAAFRVTDDAILAAQAQLAQRGLLVEPTSASTVAALPQIIAHVGADKQLVLGLTGNGLKTVAQM